MSFLSPKSASTTPKKDSRKKPKYSPVANEDSQSQQSQDLDLDQFDEKEVEDFRVSQRWDSKFFDVKPQTPKDNEFKLSDYFYEHIDRRTRCLVLPTFAIVALMSLCAIIISLIGEIQGIIGMFIIIGLTWFGALVGMCGVYRWGGVEDCTEFFARKNVEFDNEISTLKGTKAVVKKEAKNIHFSVGKLKVHGEELEKNLEAFEELRRNLEKVCGDNEDLGKMLDEINKQYDDWKELMFQNERAHLLSIYFETSLWDGEHGLTEHEYKRFLARLNRKTRDEFETQGGFAMMDRDGNGKVDLHEFQRMLDMVIESVNADEMQFLKQRSQLPTKF